MRPIRWMFHQTVLHWIEMRAKRRATSRLPNRVRQCLDVCQQQVRAAIQQVQREQKGFRPETRLRR
jgi:hypothetical protein